MSMVSAVRSWLKTCPLLSGERLNVDFLPPETGSYSVDVSPAAAIVKKYLDGSSVRQFLFSLRTRDVYGPDLLQNIENLGFFEAVTAWAERACEAGELPVLPEGRQAVRVEVLSTGTVFWAETEAAQYQIQFKLTYRQLTY